MHCLDPDIRHIGLYLCYILWTSHCVKFRQHAYTLLHAVPITCFLNLQVVSTGRAVRHGGALLRQDWHSYPQQVRLLNLFF